MNLSFSRRLQYNSAPAFGQAGRVIQSGGLPAMPRKPALRFDGKH